MAMNTPALAEKNFKTGSVVVTLLSAPWNYNAYDSNSSILPFPAKKDD